MFTFERVGCEPEMYIEDYSINYSGNGEPFIINDYADDIYDDLSIVPVLSINRQDNTVELYDFAYLHARPSDRMLLIKLLSEIVDLKEELDINNYVVIGEGAPLYYKLFNKTFI